MLGLGGPQFVIGFVYPSSRLPVSPPSQFVTTPRGRPQRGLGGAARASRATAAAVGPRAARGGAQGGAARATAAVGPRGGDRLKDLDIRKVIIGRRFGHQSAPCKS